ncbi:hypothetical protein GIB67_021860, partial [Kingdonia uniflora]
MVLEERIAPEIQRLKLKYFGDHSLKMAIPAPVPLTYQGLSGEEAIEAEDDFYYKLRFHFFVLTGEERWACLHTLVKDRVRDSYVVIGDKRLKRVKDFESRRWLYSSVVRGKLDSTADSHSDTEACRTWYDYIIWVKGNCLQRDDEEPLDLQFRSVKQSVQSTVERKESLLDEVAVEETELELVLEGLSLNRKRGLIVGRTSLAQPNPIKPGKVALMDMKKQMLKALPASCTTGSEVEERARLAILQGEEDTSKMVARLVKGIWLGIEEEKSELKKENIKLENELAKTRAATLKEVKQLKASHAVTIGQLQVETKANLDEMVEERDRLGHHLMLKGYSKEEVNVIKVDTYVEEEDEEEAEALGIVDNLDGVSRQMMLDNQGDDVELPEGGSEKAVRKTSLRINNLEAGLARERGTSKALLSAQVELDSSRSREDNILMCNREFAEQIDRMKEVNESREDQYVKTHFRLVKLTQAVSDLTLHVEEKDFEITVGLKKLAEKYRNELERMRQKFIEKDDELWVARENLSASETATKHLQIALPAKDMEFWEMQPRCNDLNERVTRLKDELAQAIVRAKKSEARERSGGSRTEKGNAKLRECPYKLDAALIREKVLEGVIKAKESLVMR